MEQKIISKWDFNIPIGVFLSSFLFIPGILFGYIWYGNNDITMLHGVIICIPSAIIVFTLVYFAPSPEY